MKLAVTDKGVIIPKELLFDVEEVEVKRKSDLLIITPSGDTDPILGLGRDPVAGKAPDASEN